jgi:glycosyltransferase involved in cell wall biosynthesis
MIAPKYSVIIPVYNRPDEVEELLESLTKQTFSNFEVILVEDGSSITCEKVFEKYSSRFSIRYFFKPNSGPGPSRNFGFEKAVGDYFIVFDSDCVIPSTYFEEIEAFLVKTPLDVWGGPDQAHKDFSPLQRAMGFTMSSFLTTGGIRGGKLTGFQPRSFNMGFRKEVFQKEGGFKFDRFAEDIEFSIRVRKAGFRVGLISEAFVYHKRRTNFKQFYHQVKNFGAGRVLVGRVHSGEVKLTHWFPAFFLMGVLMVPFLCLVQPSLAIGLLTGYFFYLGLIAIYCFVSTGSIYVSFLSAPAAFIQLTGYGLGFLKELWNTRGFTTKCL